MSLPHPRPGLRPVAPLARGVALVVGLAAAAVAHAGLGQPVASVAHDHAMLRGVRHTVVSMPGYDRHEIVTADGATVHEFASRAGTVFAVSFSGPAAPDLKTMLGDRYAAYEAGAKVRRGNHHVLSIRNDDVVVEIVRLPRGLAGTANVPALVPAGVSVDQLQ